MGRESTFRALAKRWLPAMLAAWWAASAVALHAAEHNRLTAEEIADGWIQLFDGETLFGWQAANQADWKVVEGTIVVTSGEQGLLHTTVEFADYVLKCDFRAAQGTNSGIFLRTPPKPTNPKDNCYELNIADFGSSPFATGSLVARKKAEGNFDSTDWQSYEVTVAGARIMVKLNGREVLDYTDRDPIRRGHIGLQLNSGKVEFRNVKLKPLGMKSILPDKKLAGWHEHEKLKPAFRVDDSGVLHVRGGKGQLESDTKYGDFVVRLSGRSNAARSNSGLFFRSIPGEEMNGYECQLQHSYGKDGKPNPVDCGTGGICRRQVARKLVARDGEWFDLTLVATGNHMAAWVNGYQVSNFTDERPPHANPRQGRRTEPGTLIFQAHDAATDFSFRRLEAGELPAARAAR